MRIAVRQSLAACQHGTVAVEFALVLPALASLLIGGLYAALVVYSAAGLHFAVEDAARCYSVNSAQCSTASATETFAQSAYKGLSSPAFVASTPTCGHQVAATVSVPLVAVMVNVSVPLSATACFP